MDFLWLGDNPILDFVVEAFYSIVDFLYEFIDNMVWTIEILSKAVSYVPIYISWLPEPIVALIIGCFSIVVIYKILGREG